MRRINLADTWRRRAPEDTPQIDELRVIDSDHLFALDALVDVDRQRIAGEASITVSARNRRPSRKASETKSIDHISFAANALGWRLLLAALTLRLGF